MPDPLTIFFPILKPAVPLKLKSPVVVIPTVLATVPTEYAVFCAKVITPAFAARVVTALPVLVNV